MITISPCTVNEPQITHEGQETTVENVEPGAFAKLLAGLLAKDETDDEITDVSFVDFLSIEDSAENPVDTDFVFAHNDGFQVFLDGDKTEKHSVKNIIEKDNPKAEIPIEHMNTLISADHLFVHPSDKVISSFDTDTELSNFQFEPQEISNVKIEENLAKPEQTKTEGVNSLALARAAIDEEALAGEKIEKRKPVNEHIPKESELSGKEKTETPKTAPSAENRRTGGEELASLQKEPERESRSNRINSSETRRRERLSGDKIAFEVRDYRTGASGQNNAQMRLTAAETTSRVQDAPIREITLELRLPDQSSAQTTWETKAGTALENMLSRELHQNFNGDIVRHASMALRDGGEGFIRLTLKPESLGNVKIHLKMSDNKITGHIVVESEEALNAFKKEIASLEKAFRDSGFASANLDLSMAQDGRNQEWNEQDTNPFIPRMLASFYDNSLEQEALLIDVYSGQRLNTINMLA